MGQINEDLFINGNLSAKTLTPPAASINDAAILGNAKIDPTKLRHRNTIPIELFGPTTTITALTKWLYGVRGLVGTIIAFDGAIAVQATGGDRTVTVDLQKSTGGGAFATVLSVTINITSGTVIRTWVAATLSVTSLVAGDILQAVVTVAGAAGAQAQGLTLRLVIDEDAL
jgi:hypothetical protein